MADDSRLPDDDMMLADPPGEEDVGEARPDDRIDDERMDEENTLKREYVDAARLAGLSNMHILIRQVLPNTVSPIIVMASLMVATAILLESSLSFLGLGDPNIMSWGFQIGAARTVIRSAWWLSFFPGVAIVLTVLALNLIGEGLNDALNPHLSRKGRS